MSSGSDTCYELDILTEIAPYQLERSPENRARRALLEHDGPAVGAVQVFGLWLDGFWLSVGADGAAAADSDAAAVAEDEALQRGDRQEERADGEEGEDGPVPPPVHQGRTTRFNEF